MFVLFSVCFRYLFLSVLLQDQPLILSKNSRMFLTIHERLSTYMVNLNYYAKWTHDRFKCFCKLEIGLLLNFSNLKGHCTSFWGNPEEKWKNVFKPQFEYLVFHNNYKLKWMVFPYNLELYLCLVTKKYAWKKYFVFEKCSRLKICKNLKSQSNRKPYLTVSRFTNIY